MSIDPSQLYPQRKHDFVEANQYFLLPPQPNPKDRRPRNAFGFLKGFGKAATAYFKRRDKRIIHKAQNEPHDVHK